MFGGIIGRVFTELERVRQIPGEPWRRWFQSPDEDLIIWYKGDAIVGFQFCYDRAGIERALTWHEGHELTHLRVDSGEEHALKHKRTPILVADGAFDRDALLQRFLSVSAGLPAEIERCVVERLNPGADERESRRIAAAAQTVVNTRVLRDLGRLVTKWRDEENYRRKVLKVAIPVIALVLFAAAAAATFTVISERRAAAQRTACQEGQESARKRDHASAVTQLTECLGLSTLEDEQRAQHLKLRAWAYARLGQPALAAHDQEASFKLVPARAYRDFLDYGVFLREAGRPQEGLQALLTAEKAETGRVSIMTQYQKGWVLQDLGRNAEAVEAYTRGIPLQPSYPYVYWRRGLAHESLGDKARARADFEQCARLLMVANDAQSRLLPAIRDKLRDYGLDKKYPI